MKLAWGGAGVGLAAVVTALIALGGPAGAGTANLWVDLDGGACAREAPAGAYIDSAACPSLDAAIDAASDGDLIRVRPGSYNAQNLTGDKTKRTRIIGDGDGDDVTFGREGLTDPCPSKEGMALFQGSAICISADYVTLENVTVDAGSAHGVSTNAQVNAHNVEFREVSMLGEFTTTWVQGNDFKWRGGRIGADGTLGGQRHCNTGDGQPLQLENNGPALIEGVRFNPQGSDQTPDECSENGMHLENIRIQGTPNVTLRNNYFVDGGEAGSGHVFVSGETSGDGLVFDGNYFGDLEGSYAVQVNETAGACNWTWRNNTFLLPVTCADPDSTWIGNLGVYISCTGTRVGNIIQSASAPPCAGDTIIAGPDNETGELGIGATGRLEADSPAIDVGLSCPGCPKTDYDGNVRPQGGGWDAGAFEWPAP